MSPSRWILAVSGIGVCLTGAGGCVERTMTVKSDPPGALVYLNDQELGRTPVTRDFTWYGTYDVAVRLPGYEAVKAHEDVQPPIYQIVPIDLLAEVIPYPFKDEHELSYRLMPMRLVPGDGPPLVDRAREMKLELEGSQRPATRPSR